MVGPDGPRFIARLETSELCKAMARMSKLGGGKKVVMDPDRAEKATSFMIGQVRIDARQLQAGLYLVSTPIGNLGDITIRALETLAAADILLCEDTRVTRVLLDRYGIRRPMTAYHEHNEAQATPGLIEALNADRSIALVSDAGTPLVSDPGYRLATAAIEAGIDVVPVPGASATLAALSASGLPSDSFLFAGFLPVRDGKREARLIELAAVPATLIFYESPRRLADALPAMAKILGGERQAVVARELTKAFEEKRRGTLAALAEHYRGVEAPKGEVVICIAPPQPAASLAGPELDAMLLDLARSMPASKAAAEASRNSGQPKADLYRRLLELRQKP